MIAHTVDGVEFLLWSQPHGLSAFALPWTFDLEYDGQAHATIDANRGPLNVGNYPRTVDRYRVLDGPSHAKILKAALARREDYVGSQGVEHYLVRHRESKIDEAAFLRIIAAFMHTWRRKQDVT